MVGKELALRKEGLVDLREVAAKATLREVRLKGHPYVELRRVGKRVIFFCTLCLTPCYSDNVLFDHLRGNLHSQRYAAAKVTLFGPVPWPFNDGVLFFNNSREKEPLFLADDSQNKPLVIQSLAPATENEVTSRFRGGSCPTNAASNTTNSAVSNVSGHANLKIVINGCAKTRKSSGVNQTKNHGATNSNRSGSNEALVIPGVLLKEVIMNLRVHHLGLGNIAYRVCESDVAPGRIAKIWCAWSGQEGSDSSSEQNVSRQCDFAIVNFSYTYDLGRKWGADDQDPPISPGSFFIVDDAGHRGKRRKKSFSDREASSEEKNGQCSSHDGDGEVEDGGSADADSSRQLQLRLLSSKSARQELRKQKRLAAERACDICGQPMLPEKDVATLLNCKSGNLACSSRNTNGAFHLFHASCLTHWILLCEYEILVGQSSSNKKGTRGRKGRTVKNQISTVLCPECQGSGVDVEGDATEKPTISLSEMFLYKLKAIEAHKAWMKNPEVLPQCSTGLYFPTEYVEFCQEKVMELKSSHFYRAVE